MNIFENSLISTLSSNLETVALPIYLLSFKKSLLFFSNFIWTSL